MAQSKLNQTVCQHGRDQYWDQSAERGTTTVAGVTQVAYSANRDALHDLLDPLNAMIHRNADTFDLVMIAHGLAFDALNVHYVAFTLFQSETARPVVATATAFVLRSVCQLLVKFPCPAGYFWRHPGLSSLSIDYHPAADFFFSGHTASLLVILAEYRRVKNHVASALVSALIPVVILLLLATRGHYTVDILMAFVAARVATAAADVWERRWGAHRHVDLSTSKSW